MVALIIGIVGNITGIHGGTRIHAEVDCCISYYNQSRFKEFVEKCRPADVFHPRYTCKRGSRRQVHLVV